MAAGGIGFGRSVGFFLFREGRVLSSVYALATVGPDARVNCETGQVRKEAAISMLWSGAVGSPTLAGACLPVYDAHVVVIHGAMWQRINSGLVEVPWLPHQSHSWPKSGFHLSCVSFL